MVLENFYIFFFFATALYNTLFCFIVSVLGQEEGYTVKYTREGKRDSIILTIIKLIIPSLISLTISPYTP